MEVARHGRAWTSQPLDVLSEPSPGAVGMHRRVLLREVIVDYVHYIPHIYPTCRHAGGTQDRMLTSTELDHCVFTLKLDLLVTGTCFNRLRGAKQRLSQFFRFFS